MKKKEILLLSLLSFYLLVGVISCSKKEGPQTAGAWLQGPWKLTQTGNADAGTFTLSPVPKAQNWVWTFNSNGTATEVNNYDGIPNLTFNYYWKIKGTDSLWLASSGAGHDTTTYYLLSVNSSVMCLTFPDSTITGNLTATEYMFTRY